MKIRKLGALIVALGSALVAGALWWRKNPSACPYGQRFWLELPHPFITRERLKLALDPKPGQRILEIGPGTGYYTLSVAEWITPGGTLDIFDLQEKMLDFVMQRARKRNLANVIPTQGDAQSLPYSDTAFDSAYLVAVLGEVPDRLTALRELCRVLKPGGLLVVGELFGDPHWISSKSLQREAETAGFQFQRRIEKLLCHYSIFRKEESREVGTSTSKTMGTGEIIRTVFGGCENKI